MGNFVLVHGAWGGGWCWEHKLGRLLRTAGHSVLAPDLPAHGDDPTPVQSVHSAAYVDRIAGLVNEIEGPVVLAGHSLGGTVISQVAERLPDRVAALVYVAAYLAPSGKSAVDLMRQDGDSLLTGNILLSDDRLSSRLRPEVAREALYADCSEDDIRFALPRLCPEPVAQSRVKLELSEQRFGSVPRVYIECLRDRTIGLRLQRSMQAILPCGRVEQLDTDHSPFFSAPEQLAHVLCGIA